jgi:hypothetical protein
VLTGAVKAMLADELPAVAVPMVGAPGAVRAGEGVTATTADAELVPTAFVAVTEQL